MVFHCSCSSFQIGNCLQHRLTILKKGKWGLKRCQKAIMVPTWNILTLVGVQSICTKGPACWNQCLFSLWVSVEPYSASARREKKVKEWKMGRGELIFMGSYVPSLLHSSSQRGKTWSMCITGGLRSLCDVSQPLADSQVMSVVTEAQTGASHPCSFSPVHNSDCRRHSRPWVSWGLSK